MTFDCNFQHDSKFLCCGTVPLTASMLLQAIRQGPILSRMSRDQMRASGSICSRFALLECIISLQDALSIVPHDRWYTISSWYTVISGPGNIFTIYKH